MFLLLSTWLSFCELASCPALRHHLWSLPPKLGSLGFWMLLLSLDDLSHVDLLSPTAYLLPPTLSLSLRWPYCPGGGSTFLPAMQCLLWWHSKRSVAIMYLVLCFPLGAISSSFWYTYLPFQRAVSRVWGIHLNHAKYLGILS